MEQSKPLLNCEDCTMSAWVPRSLRPIRTTCHHRHLAWGHKCAHMPFRTNWRWHGTRRHRKPSCQQRSSAWACECARVFHSSQQIYHASTLPRRDTAAHTCWIDMGPMYSVVHMVPASTVTTRSETRGLGKCGSRAGIQSQNRMS
eukprot:2292359-Amphidinium_carterae.2